MSNLFGVPLASIVADVCGPTDWPAATLIRVTYAARVSVTAGRVPTETNYATRAAISRRKTAGTPPGASMVRDESATIAVLGQPLAALGVAPEANDILSIGGERWRVVSADPDPAGAIYACSCRRA